MTAPVPTATAIESQGAFATLAILHAPSPSPEEIAFSGAIRDAIADGIGGIDPAAIARILASDQRSS